MIFLPLLLLPLVVWLTRGQEPLYVFGVVGLYVYGSLAWTRRCLRFVRSAK